MIGKIPESSASTTEPLRVILEKPKSERIFKALWNAAKLGLVLIIFSAFMGNFDQEEITSGIDKFYFDEHFAGIDKDPDAAEVAVISVFGEIADGAGAFSGTPGISSDTLTFLLHEAAKDPDVAAILLRIDSPGGTVLAAEKIFHELAEIQKEKPVFALLEGSATSAAYYIASGAEKIYAFPSTLTGNIGVIVMLPEVSGLLEKIGVDMRVITSGNLKDIGSPFREITPEETEVFTSLINESYEQFLQNVAKGREMSVDEVRALADGRVFSGLQAAKNGLIDSTVPSFSAALELLRTEIAAERVQPVEFNIPLSSWQEFLLTVKGFIPGLNSSNQFLGNINSGPRLRSQLN